LAESACAPDYGEREQHIINRHDSQRIGWSVAAAARFKEGPPIVEAGGPKFVFVVAGGRALANYVKTQSPIPRSSKQAR
jgi:hypothetical protein